MCATAELEPINRFIGRPAFDRYGQDAFRIEFLRRVIDGPAPLPSWIPYYEEVGEARVRAGATRPSFVTDHT